MEVRFAIPADKFYVVRGLQNKHMDFNTPAHAKDDIINGRLLVAVMDGKIVGSLAVVETTHGYYGLKRGCVYNKRNKGKGIMSALFDYAISLNLGDYGCTPWADNEPMMRLLAKRGFQYEKTVCEKYLVFIKKGINK